MKVNDVHGDLAISNNSTEPLQSQSPGHQEEVAPASTFPTSVEISKLAEMMERESPERAERIQTIQKALREGTYEVDPAKIARKMILDILSE